MNPTFSFTPVAYIKSPYKEKFGIPRQPGLAPSVVSYIHFEPACDTLDIVRGLEDCSHIWLIFVFSECVDKGWKPTVRPPRLGGNQRMGVFATRAPFRPNPIGMSPVELIAIEANKQSVTLVVSGADLLDGTPILDIKPYIPYADKIPNAHYDFAESFQPLVQPVVFSEKAEEVVIQSEQLLEQPLKQQICELLKCDPRPAYKKTGDQIYGVRLHNLNVRFSVSTTQIYVHEIEICS